jgi:NAD(P)-dependent dehydrogenase (short-subunit alcohol dehydrogenase family)
MAKDFEDIDLKNVESTFRSNILQMFAVTKFTLPHLNRGSSIINTTSVTAYKGSAGLSMSLFFIVYRLTDVDVQLTTARRRVLL